jgi:trans-aconitate methyltransferase
LAKSAKSTITCVEISPEMIEVAKKRLEKSENNLTFVCKDILDFKPEIKFDVIFSNLVIHNLPFKDQMEFLFGEILWIGKMKLFQNILWITERKLF